jgi:hypothetical protein
LPVKLGDDLSYRCLDDLVTRGRRRQTHLPMNTSTGTSVNQVLQAIEGGRPQIIVS